MKKHIFTLVILCAFCLSSKAQYLDGIHYRDFHNYYWEPWIDVDTSLCDVGGPKYVSGFWELCNILDNYYEVARYVYTDRPLLITGIAMLGRVATAPQDFMADSDSNLYYPQREQIAIYKPTEVFDSMVELTRGYYSLFNPKPYILSDSSNFGANTSVNLCDPSPRPFTSYDTFFLHEPVRFYEGFFEKPIEVTDSFYVAAGNYVPHIHYEYETESGVIVEAGSYRHVDYFGAIFPQQFYPQFLQFDSSNPYGRHHNKFLHKSGKWSLSVQNDTVTTYNDAFVERESIGYDSPVCDFQLYIFPIIDTLPIDSFFHYTCPAPFNLKVVDQSDNSVLLTWSSHRDHDFWQFVIVPEGSSPDDAIPITCLNNMRSHYGLQDGVRYRAYVRAQCKEQRGDIYYSDWVESEPIFIGMEVEGRGNDEVSIVTLDVDHCTTVLPNPASAQVQVFSSFPLRAVEVFDLQGKPVASPAVSDRSALFDVSGWTPGLYLVCIHTSGGTTVKKLVVE